MTLCAGCGRAIGAAENPHVFDDRTRYHEKCCVQCTCLGHEVDRLRDLLAKALPWIDPNDSHEDYLLTVAIREALGEES